MITLSTTQSPSSCRRAHKGQLRLGGRMGQYGVHQISAHFNTYRSASFWNFPLNSLRRTLDEGHECAKPYGDVFIDTQ